MTTHRPPFPEVIDSTLIADFRACHQLALRAHFQHYKASATSVDLHAGGAFARGIEVARRSHYELGQSPTEAVAAGRGALLDFYGDFECPADSPKSASRMAGALDYYFLQYPLDTDKAQPLRLPNGRVAIEFNGVDPLDFPHPVTGNPLLYSWRMDAIVTLTRLVLGCDEKTTTRLGASWGRQWDLRSQFSGYTWGAAQAGIHLDGFLVRGVSILKTKYETMEAITYRPQWQLDRWLEQVHHDLADMVRAWETGYWDYNLDNACTRYGRGCEFRKVCLMADPTVLLEQHFQRRAWNPITRQETPL